MFRTPDTIESMRRSSPELDALLLKAKKIIRLTREMNREMETIIRAYPEQYLWMHNRWKTYKGKRGLMA